MAKGFLDRLLDNIFDADWTGRHGERLTERELNLVKLFGRSGKVLRNVYVPKENGETSEIDLVFITQKGIFVIESKNYSGWIFGDEESVNWTVMLPSKVKNRFYNPIMQNKTHIKWLQKYLGDSIPLFSVIVFSVRCEVKKVSVQSDNIYVIKRDELYATVRKIWDNSEDRLTENEVHSVNGRMRTLAHVDTAVKEAHIENINKKFNKSENEISKKVHNDMNTMDVEEDNFEVCPWCGGKLLLRVAKKEYTRAAASMDAQIIQNVSMYEIQVINQSGVRRRVADVFSISCRLQDIMLK